jgi:integrase
MPLTDTAIRGIKPLEKQQKLFDSNGLFLLVFPTGSKIWRFKYRFQGKEKLISLGKYPAVSLKEARELVMEARKTLVQGKDPSAERKAHKQQLANTFELVAREWHEKHVPGWTTRYAETLLRNMEMNLFPYIGSRPVAEILPSELLAVMRKLEARNAVTMAHKRRGACSHIFRYAVVTGRAERDPATDIRGAIASRATKNRPAITDPIELGKLLIAIYNYMGSPSVRGSLRLIPHVFCRPTEMRHVEWSEIDFEAKLWRIPKEKMKMSRDHLVPLSRQALELLEEMRLYSGDGQYVFPGVVAGAQLLSSTTLVHAIRRLGYSADVMCAHGFRATASTLLNEMGYHPDVIERQLAHVQRNHVRAAYNRAEYLPERREMMQVWSDYLDSLRERARQA